MPAAASQRPTAGFQALRGRGKLRRRRNGAAERSLTPGAEPSAGTYRLLFAGCLHRGRGHGASSAGRGSWVRRSAAAGPPASLRAGRQARLALLQLAHDRGGGDGGQPGLVAVDDNLVELLLGPGGAGLGAEVVEDQQLAVQDLLEQLVEGEAAGPSAADRRGALSPGEPEGGTGRFRQLGVIPLRGPSQVAGRHDAGGRSAVPPVLGLRRRSVRAWSFKTVTVPVFSSPLPLRRPP